MSCDLDVTKQAQRCGRTIPAIHMFKDRYISVACFRLPTGVPWRATKLCPLLQCVEDECWGLPCKEGRLKSLRAPCRKLWCISRNNHGEIALLAWHNQKNNNTTRGWREIYTSCWKYDKKCIRCAGIQHKANTTTTTISIRTTFRFARSATRLLDIVCWPGICRCHRFFPIKLYAKPIPRRGSE